MLYINDYNFQQLKSRFPEYQMYMYCESGTWQTSRYIQIYIPAQDHSLHYEYCIDHDWEGHIELHFEGDNWEEKYGLLIDYLMEQTQNNDNLYWANWHYGFYCQLSHKISTIDDLILATSNMIEVFGEKIKKFGSSQSTGEFIEIPINDTLGIQNGDVDIYTKCLEEILQLPLTIPNYQRNYCWEKKNVLCLLDDIFSHLENSDNNNVPYRLGTIILHCHDNIYDIIDGQQRIVTLSLVLYEMGIKSHLLDEKFSSKQSRRYIAYNKYLISNYLQKHLQLKNIREKIMSNLVEFTVLVLNNTSLDLAYSFFSNQNSRGVELTDYDLLKAHHLRYIPLSFEQQSRHAAEIWNSMIEKGRVDKDSLESSDYVCTLDTYIYRLRKWMRKKECEDESNNYHIKKEYEAAPVVDEIPPFGEKFYFNEPIQGGTHFFSFVEQNLEKYHQFVQTEEYKCLHYGMDGGSNRWYRDAIESILFGYFLKFGSFYMADALSVIMRIILQHRYDNGRAYKTSIVQYVGNSELILIIDQATSPTFFLAEARNIAKDLSYPTRQNMKPIMLNLRNKAAIISKNISKNIVVESFKTLNK